MATSHRFSYRGIQDHCSISCGRKIGLQSQIRRSAVSIASNIAEGAGRNSNGEFRQFLGIAYGSAYELETQLLISRNLAFISDNEINPVVIALETIQKMIFKLKSKL